MGAVLEIDPFDEPNVSESKEKTKALLSAGTLPPQEPALRSQGLALFASAAHAQVLRKAAARWAARRRRRPQVGSPRISRSGSGRLRGPSSLPAAGR